MAESTAATTTLRRHNSIPTSVTLPRKLCLSHRTTSLDAPPQNHGTTTLDLELASFSIKSPSSSSYTSLRDVLPCPNAAVNSPTASSAAIITDISIRNRLVKHAAWAYLQPMPASTSSAPHFLRRLSHSLYSAAACLSSLFRHLVPCFARIFHRLLYALRGQVSTS